MDFENLTDNEIAVARFKCDESLLYFTRFWFRLLRGTKFVTNWHHEDICLELERVQNYELEYLGINISPRFSKTEIAAVNLIARGLGMNPTGNYFYITASDELRSETSTRIRDIVSHPVFKRMYGVSLKADQTAKNLWRTKQGGGLKTATIFGQITGFGAGQMVDHSNDFIEQIREFEGCLVLDDIDKIDDAGEQNANNKKVLRIIGNTVLSRKNSADTPIINIQQRAGLNDSTAYFKNLYKNNPKAKNLVFPIIINGESMWPWKMPMDKIKELAESPETRHTFETQYMQNPQPKEGLMFGILNEYEELNNEEGITIAWADTADDGTDHFAMPIGRVINKKVYIIDVIFNRKGLESNIPLMLGAIEKYNVDLLGIETNREGGLLVKVLKQQTKCPIRGYWSSGKKMTRIYAQSATIEDNFYFKANQDPESEYYQFMKQVRQLLKTSKTDDDAPDSLSGLAKFIRLKYPEILK